MSEFKIRFERCVELFEQTRDKDGSQLSMISFAANANGESAHHLFQPTDREADLRSVSKVVVALVAGVLIETQTRVGGAALTLDTRIEPLLRQHMSAASRKSWEHVRVLDLLNNTIGHEQGFLFRKDLGNRPESEYLTYIFERPIHHAPGTHFSYSNVGPFLCSVIVQDWLGKSLHELARTSVLDSLEINSEWRKFGSYDAGCTGLSMKNADLIKLATLLRNGGILNGAVIVSRKWIERMGTAISRTPGMYDGRRVLPKFAYGIALWICETGTFYCDGTNGQYLIVVPEKRLAMSTTGEQVDMKPITRCMVPLLEP
jgi:CubicO group peptidase (beta-lactamase class C family)